MKTLWTPRIYTPSGFVREDMLEGVRALDLGCGNRKLPGAVGVDSLALKAVDVVHDLFQFPWPFKDANFDLVFANHFLEHAPDIIKTMNEIHRILVPGGRVVIQVPYFRSVDAMTDPTHRHFFTAGSLDPAIKGTKTAEYEYTNLLFKQMGFWYGWPQPSKNPLARAFKAFIHSHTYWYDQYASVFFPAACVTWELEKLDSSLSQ